MSRDRYFDNAATTPLDARVREAMLHFLDDAFGNANSIHQWGLRAREAVEHAREQVARLIGAADPSQIIFTSGATESNNWVLKASHDIVISPFEHSAMREPALRRGARILSNQGYALLPAALDPRSSALLSVMRVNNETGAILDVKGCMRPGDILHSDITQAVGKIPVTMEGLDFASFSGHKFYGPKGIGVLYCTDQPPDPLILGGEQEHGFRGGTLNVPAIVGLGRAAEAAMDEQAEDLTKASELRSIVLDGLFGLSETQINEGPETSPFILSISFRGLEGETLVLELDRSGFAISAGAACSSRSTEPSHVLTALGLDPQFLRGTVRISFGRFNTSESAASLARELKSAVDRLRNL